jgi:cation-transporting ATPase I
VLAELGTSRAGLSARDALARRGPVARTVSAPFQFGQAVASELANPLVPVLAGGAALSAMVGSTADAAVIGAVTGANALLGAAQRFRAERAVRALDESHQILATVLERGRPTTVSAEALVRGSVITVEAGSVVGADARVLEANGLEVDESTLTGESLPVTKDPAPCFTTIVAERTSMVYEGTTVVAGSGTAVVVATGRDTEAFADIGPLDDRPQASGVDARLARLSAVTLPFAALGGLGVIGAGLVRGQPLRRTLGVGVSLAVAAVPEGLPMLATVAQLSAARRLSARGALVRNPRAIEALGRVEVLCTDKTGTLTEGRISLQTVSDGTRTYAVDALNDHALAIVAAGRRASPEATVRSPMAHPTDQAIVDGAVAVGAQLDDGVPGWSLLDALPFEPARGYHATVGGHDGGTLLSVKGAPETVLTRCTARRGPGGVRALTPATRKRLERSVDDLARRGLRVLAVAEAALSPEQEICDDDVDGLVFLGFLALADPVRPSAAAAVDGLRRAGVEVVMVTGDHPSTAEGIAAELGILNGHRVMTGGELEQLDDAALAAVLTDVSVFARVTPADKVRIVRAYQASGIAVAMTGDGANDAPAIRLADAGLALGANATAAARDAADVIITDERIETIVDAIIEGRAMWASVREALAILLGGNLGEIGFTVAVSGLTGRTPLSSRQLLLVNMLTDVAPSMAIAVRPPRNHSYDDLAAEGPDRSLGASLNRAIALRAVTTAAGAGAAWGIASLTGGPKRAGTVSLVSLVGTQLGQTLTSGGMHPSVLLASVGSAAALVAIVQTPGVSQFFGCTPLDPLAWATAAGAAATATGLAAVLPPAFGLLRKSVTPETREPATPTVAT